MASTSTAARTLAQVLNGGNPNEIADALAQLDLGKMLSPLKATVVGITPAAAIDITAIPPSATAGFVVNQGAPASSSDVGVAVTSLPPILAVVALRTTAQGAGTAGPYVVTDAGGAAVILDKGAVANGIALLSDDGKTLTFANTVSAFVIEYIPRPTNDPSTTTWAPNH